MRLTHRFPPYSKLASEYDSRFEKTIVQLVEEIQKRRYFISTDWVEDDDDDEEGDDGADKAIATKADDTTVRLLDYACGTGLISRVCYPAAASLVLQTGQVTPAAVSRAALKVASRTRQLA